MSSFYQLQTPRHDDNIYFDETAFSSTTAMFPPDMSDPYMDNSQLLNIPQSVLNHRPSISTSSDLSFQQAYLSRPPSLSPSSQSMLPLHPAQQSPHSSASPSSNFSISATDEFLLANSFSNNELEMFLFQNSELQTPQAQLTGKQALYLPQNRGFEYHSTPITQHNLTQDSMQNRYSVVSESYPMPKMEYTNMASVQPPIQPQFTQQPSFNPAHNAWQETKPTFQRYPDGECLRS